MHIIHMILLVFILSLSQYSALSLAATYEQSKRRPPNEKERPMIARVLRLFMKSDTSQEERGICTAFFVKNKLNRYYLSLAEHCAPNNNIHEACQKNWIYFRTENNETAYCKEVLIASREHDQALIEIYFPMGAPKKINPLSLSAIPILPVNTRLRLIGYPENQSHLPPAQVTTNCWTTANTTFFENYRNIPTLRELNSANNSSQLTNCTSHGGNSGGPVLFENTDTVIATKNIGIKTESTYSTSNGLDHIFLIWTWAYEYREKLEKLGVIVEFQAPTKENEHQVHKIIKYLDANRLRKQNEEIKNPFPAHQKHSFLWEGNRSCLVELQFYPDAKRATIAYLPNPIFPTSECPNGSSPHTMQCGASTQFECSDLSSNTLLKDFTPSRITIEKISEPGKNSTYLRPFNPQTNSFQLPKGQYHFYTFQGLHILQEHSGVFASIFYYYFQQITYALGGTIEVNFDYDQTLKQFLGYGVLTRNPTTPQKSLHFFLRSHCGIVNSPKEEIQFLSSFLQNFPFIENFTIRPITSSIQQKACIAGGGPVYSVQINLK